jgi:hypothetical protein
MYERHTLRRGFFTALVGLTGSLLWLVIGTGGSADAATLHTSSTRLVDPPNATHGHLPSHTPVHKEGALAVAFSIIGIIAVLVGVVFLGSISARRRMGGKPFTREQRGPPGGRQGLFG